METRMASIDNVGRDCRGLFRDDSKGRPGRMCNIPSNTTHDHVLSITYFNTIYVLTQNAIVGIIA